MFGQIAKLRREPRNELLAASHVLGRRGAPPDLTQLLQRHRAAVVHFLYRMVQDRAVAEELAVEVFLRVYRSPGEWSVPAAESATRLFRVATHLALKELPNKKSQPPSALPADVFEEAGRAMACIPGEQRAAVLMHKYHRMDSWQIATVLDCPESVARSLLLSAYDRLRGWTAGYQAPRSLDYTAQ
jgi:RNA polymerase sigma-70 factor (ECF subfamily)